MARWAIKWEKWKWVLLLFFSMTAVWTRFIININFKKDRKVRVRCFLGEHLNEVYTKEALLHIIVAIFLVTPCQNDENYQCALSKLERKDESSWSPIEKPSISFPFRNQRVATILQSKKLIILHKSAHFAYWGFVWALLSSSRYMQFNMAGLEQNYVTRILEQKV